METTVAFTSKSLEELASEGALPEQFSTKAIGYFHFFCQGTPEEERKAVEQRFLLEVPEGTVLVAKFDYFKLTGDQSKYWASGIAVVTP